MGNSGRGEGGRFSDFQASGNDSTIAMEPKRRICPSHLKVWEEGNVSCPFNGGKQKARCKFTNIIDTYRKRKKKKKKVDMSHIETYEVTDSDSEFLLFLGQINDVDMESG